VTRLEARLDKQHMPYPLDQSRLQRYRELFIEPSYEVTELPGYDPAVASNPFRAFERLPVASRYRFLLEQAQFTLMGFIKGPVCHGQTSLNVIRDRFWVTFIDPDVPWVEEEATFLARVEDQLDLPGEDGSSSMMLSWFELAKKERAYLTAKSEHVEAQLAAGKPISLEWLWDGDGNDDDAALTVFRHFDSSTVEKGLIGGRPLTAWVLGYALLERMHYLLVAGFDVFGNVGHQVSTRLYMDFLRMESEQNFLLLLPTSRRSTLVNLWYRAVDDEAVKDELMAELTSVPFEPAIVYQSPTPELELFEAIEQRLSRVSSKHTSLERIAEPAVRASLARLDQVYGRAGALSGARGTVFATPIGMQVPLPKDPPVEPPGPAQPPGPNQPPVEPPGSKEPPVKPPGPKPPPMEPPGPKRPPMEPPGPEPPPMRPPGAPPPIWSRGDQIAAGAGKRDTVLA
jgi:hypothetical protein